MHSDDTVRKIILFLASGLMFVAMTAQANIGTVQIANNTVPAGGYLLDDSMGFLYQNADGTGRLLAR